MHTGQEKHPTALPISIFEEKKTTQPRETVTGTVAKLSKTGMVLNTINVVQERAECTLECTYQQ